MMLGLILQYKCQSTCTPTSKKRLYIYIYLFSPHANDVTSLRQSEMKQGNSRLARNNDRHQASDTCDSFVMDMLESRKMTEKTNWRTKQPSQVVSISEGLKC